MAKKIHSLGEVVGHRMQVAYLQKLTESDSVPDVIILHGNPGIGKSSIAKILAVEVVSYGLEDAVKAEYIETVIDKSIDADAVKVFNMSNIRDKEEEIQSVKTELCTGFTRNQRKVLILDEAHRMSERAQDAILVELESLPQGVYVFFCTTEINALQESLRSRSKITLHLKELSDKEIKQVIQDAIRSRRLQFEAREEMVIAAIANWAGNQPRKALNLIENFEEGSVVSTQDLSVFVDSTSTAAVIELMKYLYGSLTLGMDYIDNMRIDESFISSLIEVCKVALGHMSRLVSRDDTLYIHEFMASRPAENFMSFTAMVSGLQIVRKRQVISAFMRCHISYQGVQLPVRPSQESKTRDMQTLRQNVETQSFYASDDHALKPMSIESMFAQAEVVE